MNAEMIGLSSEEAQKLQEEYGPNEIVEKSQSPLIKFLSYFWGPIPWMIEAAILLSAAVRDWTDFIIISLLLIVNAVVGFVEEFQADNAIDALKKNLAIKARVLRDGIWTSISAGELVPGDIIRLRLGDIVPADSILSGEGILKIDESALTGESLPAEKKTNDIVYSGSIVKQGELSARVKAIGGKTYFGKTASLIENVHMTSHFQKAVLKIGNYLIMLALSLVTLILITALFRGDNILEILRFSLVLTIAAIPVAMPSVLSVTMAVGARLLSTKKAVVRKLASIEELAGMDILCTDKTGTLTQNKLSLGEFYLRKNVTEDDLILFASLASKKEDQDPIDTTILGGIKDEKKLAAYKVVDFKPFDPVRKLIEAEVIDSGGKKFKVSKGAPQVILSLAKDSADFADEVNAKINEFAERGFRSLGVARTNEKNNWEFLGIISLFDPPREDSKRTIESARENGIKVKMITGDQQAIAVETSRQLGIGRYILNSTIFENVKNHRRGMIEDEIEKANGFSEVFPEHKYHIVEVLQKRDHIVGMTGDGVNDAPALKKADCGIAVSGATDAARAAADIVLLSPGLSVIIDALKESRKIFQRMNSYTIYRITETIRILFFMTLSILVFNFYPVTAVMIVLLALLNDGAILSIAYDNTTISKKPEKWDMHLIFILSSALGLMGVVESFGLFYLGDVVYHIPRDALQTMIYLKLSIAGHLTVFVARTRKSFWTSRPSNKLLGAVIITQAVATVISAKGIFMKAIGWDVALLIWAYCLIWFFVEDGIKLLVYKSQGENIPHNWRKLMLIKNRGY